jgi:hypothetical protein
MDKSSPEETMGSASDAKSLRCGMSALLAAFGGLGILGKPGLARVANGSTSFLCLESPESISVWHLQHFFTRVGDFHEAGDRPSSSHGSGEADHVVDGVVQSVLGDQSSKRGRLSGDLSYFVKGAAGNEAPDWLKGAIISRGRSGDN